MARGIKDVRYAGFRTFVRDFQVARREVRAMDSEETTPRETSLVHDDLEKGILMRYLVAKKVDDREGVETHVAALKRDRHAWRVLMRIMARVPAEDVAVNS